MPKLHLTLAMVLILAGAVTARQDRYTELGDAITRHKGDPEALKRDLAEAEVLVAQNPSNGRAYFLRARALSALDRGSDAIAEYRRAISLSPDLARVAHYNIGVILSGSGRRAEAIVEYEQVLRLDPNDVDAAYNLGQDFYLLERFDDALRYWSIAQRLTPDDFQVARKMVQTYNALGRYDEAARAREEVLRIRRQGNDAAAANAKTWVFDQMVLPAGRIYAREPFIADDAIYRFEVVDPNENIVGRMTFRSAGDRFVLSVDGQSPAPDQTVSFASRPAWRELRVAVRDLALKAFSIR